MLEGKALKQAGMGKVLSNNVAWKAQALAQFKRLRRSQITGEGVRVYLTEKGVVPNHPNAWGGFIAGLVRKGALVSTGEHVSMKDPRSHARKTSVYSINRSFLN